MNFRSLQVFCFGIALAACGNQNSSTSDVKIKSGVTTNAQTNTRLAKINVYVGNKIEKTCSGTFIGPQTIITAGKCLKTFSRLDVIYGEKFQHTVSTTWSKRMATWGLVHLPHPVVSQENLWKLPKACEKDSGVYLNTTVDVYGRTSHGQEGEGQFYSKNVRTQPFADQNGDLVQHRFHNSSLILGSRDDTDKEDVGGPWVWGNTIVGTYIGNTTITYDQPYKRAFATRLCDDVELIKAAIPHSPTESRAPVCAEFFAEKNMQDSVLRICSDGSQSVSSRWNNNVSSARLDPGAVVFACENGADAEGNGKGLCSYFSQTTAFVGDFWNNRFSHFELLNRDIP